MDRIPHDINPPRRPNPSPRRPIGQIVFFIVVVLVLLLGGRAINFWVDWRWYSEVGYTGVFWTLLWAQWGLGIVFGLAFLVISLPNIYLAQKLLPPPAIPVDLRGQVEMVARKTLGPLLYGGAFIVAFLTGTAASSEYQDYLLYRASVPFHILDPLFHIDVSYFVFQLPFVSFVVGFILTALVLTIIGVGFAYVVAAAQYYDPVRGWLLLGRRIPPQAARHISVLAAIALLVRAYSYYLQRYDLLYSSSDVVSAGAGYADVHAALPVLYILMVLTVFVAILWLAQLAAKKVTWGLFGIVGIILVSLVGGEFYPGLVEQVTVKPNQFTKEEPYIRSNIDFTRSAYGLDATKTTDFPIHNDASPGLIQRNAATIANTRLWDYNIAAQAYSQLQEIKPYYQFNSVDVDRYTLDGKYRQVLISVREMNQDLLPQQAKTFVNQHLVYTHGFGVCVSPVNEVSPDNQPNFLMKGIPPTTTTDLKLDQPRIYFGESNQDWAVVESTSSELDYPGTTDVYKNYNGKAGLRIGGRITRMALAGYLGWNSDFLLSSSITPDSRLLIHRQLVDRIQMVAPFLTLDRDPYPVIADGRIIWIQDAYTTTDRYPYSEVTNADTPYNYIRNSVKIAMDAYDGTMTFYEADPTDPILQAYARVFPGMFKPLSSMPLSLLAHLRYPEDLFNIQSAKFLTYHMTDARTFFTKEDAWDVPKNARGPLGQQADSAMEAYYVIMRLPGEKTQEMVMIRPFTPRSKNNMVAWMAARCDQRAYGQIVTYRFPIDNLPLGPNQMDASILQKPDISKDLTLLNQQGSQVVLGNMLTIPLEQSLLYVQPLYVQSENQGNRRAELARVIVAYGDRVEMGNSLAAALNDVFGEGATSTSLAPTPSQPGARAPKEKAGNRELVQRASQAWNKAQTAQKAGDWAAYGAALKDLEHALKDLERANP